MASFGGTGAEASVLKESNQAKQEFEKQFKQYGVGGDLPGMARTIQELNDKIERLKAENIDLVKPDEVEKLGILNQNYKSLVEYQGLLNRSLEQAQQLRNKQFDELMDEVKLETEKIKLERGGKDIAILEMEEEKKNQKLMEKARELIPLYDANGQIILANKKKLDDLEVALEERKTEAITREQNKGFYTARQIASLFITELNKGFEDE